MSKSTDYGRYYWGIKMIDGSQVYLMADQAVVTDGALMFVCERLGVPVAAFAAGEWERMWAASMIDDCPVAVDHTVDPDGHVDRAEG